MSHHENEPFCDIQEARGVTPFCDRTFRAHIKNGDIPHYRLGKGMLLFKKSEVIAAIEKCRVATTAEVLS
jgi:hypothetical protein